jgi:beta-lactam-binding protein with PASTA domain
MHDDDDPVVLPPAETEIQPPRRVPPTPLDPDADINVVHEEERVRVLPDGTVERESDRIEEQPPSRFRELLPWIAVAVVGVLIIAGLGIWYFTRSSSKTVPAVVGMTSDAAVSRLQQDGFKVQITQQSNSKPSGIVFGQNPGADTKADDGSTVKLLVSKGPSQATVPNAVGLPKAEARDRLVNAGFKVTSAQVFSDQHAGNVVAQAPAAGDRVAPHSTVRINVSKGTGTVAVPSVVGTTVDQAQSQLTAEGFKPVVTHVQSDSPADTVVAQTPSGGQAPKGSTVQLSVSSGQTTTTSGSTTTVTTPTTTTTSTATVTTPTTSSG